MMIKPAPTNFSTITAFLFALVPTSAHEPPVVAIPSSSPVVIESWLRQGATIDVGAKILP